jgi:hypothetical protein
MSLLANPGFESPTSAAPWDRMNLPNTVDFNIIKPASVARSGEYCLRFKTSQPGGSMGQDTGNLTIPSVTVLAYVSAEGPNPVSGRLAIWELDPGADQNNWTDFNAQPGQWTLVTCVKQIMTPPSRIRVEFYLNTTNAYLYIDSVNAF